MRLRFSNVSGKSNVELDSITVWNKNVPYAVTLNDDRSIVIPKGDRLYSDVIRLPIEIEDEIEVRMHYKTAVNDLNHTELSARLYHGNQTDNDNPLSKPTQSILSKLMGIYVAIPTLDRIEIETMKKPKVIVAFGDSITAMNQWVAPLQERLHQKYHDEYCLMNAGISGNCLLYEIMFPFANLFGRKGVDRFETDVLKVEHLHTLIFALGINDVSYYHKKTKDVINFENYCKAVMKMTDQVHERSGRIVVCTLTPRKGFKLLKFTPQMEALRIQINEWIRSCDRFDAVIDMDAVIRDDLRPGMMDDRYHIGDHLHPNSVGGQRIAYAIDLHRLVGRKD